jgi:2-hydroxy-3-keto-5-methylthiopentenyl-1-phosphate phosphatase
VMSWKTRSPFGQRSLCKSSEVRIDVLHSDSFIKMLDSVTTPFPECVDYLVKNIKLDPHFNEYFQWALKNNIPTVILSGGMYPVIHAILKNLVGPDADKLDIVCNDAVPRDGKSMDEVGGWKIKFHDERYYI